MRVLIAQECSGKAREAFRRLGHDCWSVDIKPSEDNSPFHHTGDAKTFLEATKGTWDLIIAHPVCTYLANSGVCNLHQKPKAGSKVLRGPARWAAMREAADFFNFYKGKAPMVCIENPIMHLYGKALVGGKQTQLVQPYQFGHTESKATCYWLFGLPKLVGTKDVKAEMMALPLKERQKCWWGGSRSKVDRSRSFQGICDAMAAQWGSLPVPTKE